MLSEGDLVLSLGAGNVHEQLATLAAQLVVAERLKEIVGAEGEVRLFEPLAKHTTLRVGGPAQFWVEPRSEEAFAKHYLPASKLIGDICLSEDYTDFLTTPAYELVG